MERIAYTQDKMERIKNQVQKMMGIVSKLEVDFPGRHFTLDGHLRVNKLMELDKGVPKSERIPQIYKFEKRTSVYRYCASAAIKTNRNVYLF